MKSNENWVHNLNKSMKQKGRLTWKLSNGEKSPNTYKNTYNYNIFKTVKKNTNF